MLHLLLWYSACGNAGSDFSLGAWNLTLEGDRLSASHALYGPVLEDLTLAVGRGEASTQMRMGSFLFEDLSEEWSAVTAFGRVHGREVAPIAVDLLGEDGASLGTLVITQSASGDLILDLSADDAAANRASFQAACDADDHFLGGGAHAMDVDHVGQAFPLWVSEPGIGKSADETPTEDWFATGTRHQSSLPIPFFLRPHRSQGLLLDVPSRVDADLCASDPARFSLAAWQGSARLVVFAGARPRDAIAALTAHTGRPALPPPWVFAPWNDAVRGSARVREVAATLRAAGAPSSVIWTEDWKGAEETFYGYHLSGEWSLDEGLYPDAAALAAELDAAGFQWFAYFNTFLRSETRVYDEAVAAGVTVQTEDGAPYLFTGPAFVPEAMLDLSHPDAAAFATRHMEAALDLGFDGWMADFAEWLPTDARLASGEDPWTAHNTYPLEWAALNAEVLEGRDASFFVRSGWVGSSGIAPVVWAGDQSTSFLEDDGLPTVVAMGLSLAASGVPIFTHDVAGYQTFGVGPSSKELWFRWAELGAFSPILRTHHGTEDQANWQFDRDEETLAHWTRLAREHIRLWPYRYGLARRASDEGLPMLSPVALLYGEDWGRKDAWMLGDSLLVAPVLVEGARTRHVVLPEETRWYDWWTHAPATTGDFEAPLDHIPVFAATGTTVPLFEVIPDTLLVRPGMVDFSAADASRHLLLFGGGGVFTEGDGTTYRPTGTPTGPGEQTTTLTRGTLEVAGVTVQIDGEVERTYRVQVIP